MTIIRTLVAAFGLLNFTVCSTVCLAQSPLPVGQREYEVVYDRLEHDEALVRSRFDCQLGPYNTFDSTRTPGVFASRLTLSPTQIQAFGFASEGFRTAADVRGRMYALMRGGVIGQPFKNLAVLGQFYLDERKAKDPAYTGKKWRGFAGDIDQAFAVYSTGRFQLAAGRYSSFWGIRHSLVLGSGVHLDGFGYSLRWGRLTASYRFARVGDRLDGTDTLSQWPNRYFAAHRFDFHFSDAVRVGLFESVIFGGPGRSPDLAYLNPIIFFHGSQLNENVDDNTFVGFDFTYKPKAGIKLYGQLLVDDIQFDSKSAGDHEPAEYALTAGVYTASPHNRCDTRLEYTRVTNRTFNQILSRNRYTDHGLPIADVDGNDFDRVTFDVIRWLKPSLYGSLRLSYKRQGEGRINAPWSEPWLSDSGTYHESFPSGTVEKAGAIALAMKGYANSVLFVDIQAGLARTVNYDNHRGDSRTLPFVDCYISLYFSRILNLD